MWEDNRMIRRAICLPKNLLWGKWRGNRICNAIPFFFWFHRNSVLFKRIFKADDVSWSKIHFHFDYKCICTCTLPVFKSFQKINFDFSLILIWNLKKKSLSFRMNKVCVFLCMPNSARWSFCWVSIENIEWVSTAVLPT